MPWSGSFSPIGAWYSIDFRLDSCLSAWGNFLVLFDNFTILFSLLSLLRSLLFYSLARKLLKLYFSYHWTFCFISFERVTHSRSYGASLTGPYRSKVTIRTESQGLSLRTPASPLLPPSAPRRQSLRLERDAAPSLDTHTF